MSDSKKVTRKKSIYNTLAGLFRKKLKEPDSDGSESQGQTSRPTDGQAGQGASKNLRRDIYRKVNNADATSGSGTPNTPSIDPAHVSRTGSNRDDKREKSPKSTGQIIRAVDMESNGHRGDKGVASGSNSNEGKPQNEAGKNIFTETELIDTFNKDSRISKLKINNTDSKIVINQIDNSIKKDLNSENDESAGDLREEKISSEIMKRKWFNNEIVNEVPKGKPVVVVAAKEESGEKIPIVVPEFVQAKTKEIIAATDAILKDEKHIKVEQKKEDIEREESQILIEVEKKERNTENDYFTTGKYISFFLLQIERQYHDPTEVYSMVRYRDPEDSDDSDSEGSEFLKLIIIIIPKEMISFSAKCNAVLFGL